MGGLKTGPFPFHHKQHHSTTREGFGETQQPHSEFWTAIDQPKEIEHVVGLGANRFAFAGDQIASFDFDGWNPLLGDQLFNQSLTAQRIGLEVAGSLKRCCGDLAADGSCWSVFRSQCFELQ